VEKILFAGKGSNLISEEEWNYLGELLDGNVLLLNFLAVLI